MMTKRYPLNQMDKLRIKQSMTILVSGDRNWEEHKILNQCLRYLKPKHIIEGGARGADRLAGEYALAHKIRLTVVNAEWELYGRAAGPIRNIAMLGYKPDYVLAFHNNITQSKGTEHMIAAALNERVRVILVTLTTFMRFTTQKQFAEYLLNGR